MDTSLVSRGYRETLQILVLASILGLATSVALQQGLFGASSATSSEGQPPHVSLDEARKMFENGSALFIDSRHGFDFQLGHIPGAINLPLSEFESMREFALSLPRNKVFITYCDGQECNSSDQLAQKLVAAGLTDVRVFFGGWTEWKSSGGPAEGTPR